MTDRNPLAALLETQAEQGHLGDDVLRALSAELTIPLYELEGLVSFYPHFRRAPRAPVELDVCRDLACAMRGAAALKVRLEEFAEAGEGIRVRTVSCLGRCDTAPACLMNEEPTGLIDVAQALGGGGDELAEFAPTAAGPPALDAAAPRTDPYSQADDHYAILRNWVASNQPRRVIDQLVASGLRGMGGAGFPTGRKWALVADQPSGSKTVICNADESEPGTFKDREILARLPHLVIEGMALAGLSVGADRGVVFVRHEYGPETGVLRRAVERAREIGAIGPNVFDCGRAFDIEIFVSPGGYILGEETALLEALEGRRGEPRNKPPFPGVVGLHGRPTLINNVETLAQVPRIAAGEPADLKFFSVSGDVKQPGVHEVPLGTTLSELIERCGGMRDDLALMAFLPGGASTGFLGPEHLDLPLDWASLEAAGSALGSGAVIVVAQGADLRALAGNLTAFFRNESCGKCVPCRIGTERAVKWIEEDGPLDAERLRALHVLLADTSICGLGQAALKPITSVLQRIAGAER